MKWLAVLALATGCDAVFGSEFDPDAGIATVDTPPGCAVDDEDCDSLLDEVDGCPAHPDPAAADIDTDGIGDLCDPERDLAGDTRVWFDRLDRDNGWMQTQGAWQFGGGVLRLGPGGGATSRLFDPVVSRPSVVLRISDIELPEEGDYVGITLTADTDPATFFTCGVRRQNGMRELGITVVQTLTKPFDGDGPIYLTAGQLRNGRYYCRGAYVDTLPIQVTTTVALDPFAMRALSIGGLGSAAYESILVLTAP